LNDPSPSPPPARWLVLIVLMIVNAFNLLDRQLLAVLAEPVRKELGLTDTQLGLLTGTLFVIFYATLAIPIAWIADRRHRVRVLACALAAWSFFTALCGQAHSFLHLALARVGVGIGEAGGAPASYSLISDCFDSRRRGMALAIYGMGVPLGMLAGIAAGGWIASRYGWRLAFTAIGAMGVVLALAIPLLIREPSRGRLDATVSHGPPPSPLATLRMFARSRPLMMMAATGGAGAFITNGLLSWMPTYLARTKGMQLQDLAQYYSIALGLSLALGISLSGYLTDRFAHRRASAYALIPAIGLAASLPFYLAALLTSSWQTSLALLSVPICLGTMFLTPTIAFAQNHVRADQRSTVSALLMFVLNLIGIGGGPLFVGFMSDALQPHYGALSLHWAMLSLCTMFVVAILICLATASTLAAHSSRSH
jgi:predicted MFS family arabinose efflux permease